MMPSACTRGSSDISSGRLTFEIGAPSASKAATHSSIVRVSMAPRMRSAIASIGASFAGSIALNSGPAPGSSSMPIALRICSRLSGVSAPRMIAPSFTW